MLAGHLFYSLSLSLSLPLTLSLSLSFSFSLAICPYRLLLFVSPEDGIQFLPTTEKYKFMPVNQNWCVHKM